MRTPVVVCPRCEITLAHTPRKQTTAKCWYCGGAAVIGWIEVHDSPSSEPMETLLSAAERATRMGELDTAQELYEMADDLNAGDTIDALLGGAFHQSGPELALEAQLQKRGTTPESVVPPSGEPQPMCGHCGSERTAHKPGCIYYVGRGAASNESVVPSPETPRERLRVRSRPQLEHLLCDIMMAEARQDPVTPLIERIRDADFSSLAAPPAGPTAASLVKQWRAEAVKLSDLVDVANANGNFSQADGYVAAAGQLRKCAEQLEGSTPNPTDREIWAAIYSGVPIERFRSLFQRGER